MLWATITLPVWLVVAVALLATITAVNHFLLPGVRWLLRRRLNQVINDVNKRLRLELPTFQLTKRQVLVDRLTYDPEVMRAVAAAAEQRGVPREGIMAEVLNYAREMVPAFNAYFYFRIGYRLARRFLRTFYRVRVGYVHEGSRADVPAGTSMVFFINHRSNMDYLLVTYLASGSTALSYGAGEWARVWPFRSVLRLAGAYILRRDTSDPLYRMVLQRYVQMATRAGVPHAIFAEGRLSRNGEVNAPKLGLLGYIAKAFDPDGDHDVVFVPVATNFDRVPEDRTLIANIDTDFLGRGVLFVLGATSQFLLRRAWRWITGRARGFGVACANFGEPLSLRDWSREHAVVFRNLDKAEMFAAVETLGNELTRRIIDVMPVLAVPSISLALLKAESPLTTGALKRQAIEEMATLRKLGAHIAIEDGGESAAIEAGLALLIRRKLVVVDQADGVTPDPGERDLLAYYANSVIQLRAHLERE